MDKTLLLGLAAVGGLLWAASMSSEGAGTEDFAPEDIDEFGEPAPLAPPEQAPAQIPTPAAPTGYTGSQLFQAASRYQGYRYPECIERGEVTTHSGRRTVCLKREDPNGATGALDCSGVIWKGAADLGVSIERRASLQQPQTHQVDETTARQTPGALVFFWNKDRAGNLGVFHVEMSSGDGQVLGSRTTTGVRLRTFGDWAQWKPQHRPDLVTYGVLPQFSSTPTTALAGWFVGGTPVWMPSTALQGWFSQHYTLSPDRQVLLPFGGCADGCY